mmetsp:Transcript_22132/g.48392  ORF Transcript_22132/g.48392 Transcript_22132/m.48392 type:complete len:80 (+) Transcript_22132:664-903(+)
MCGCLSVYDVCLQSANSQGCGEWLCLSGLSADKKKTKPRDSRQPETQGLQDRERERERERARAKTVLESEDLTNSAAEL